MGRQLQRFIASMGGEGAAAAAVRRNWVQRARRGLYGGRTIQSGNKISEDGNNKSRRKWKPNSHPNTMFSEILGRKVSVTTTSYALRCMDKAGGLDAYILSTSEKDLASDFGSALRLKLETVLELRKDRAAAAAAAAAQQLRQQHSQLPPHSALSYSETSDDAVKEDNAL